MSKPLPAKAYRDRLRTISKPPVTRGIWWLLFYIHGGDMLFNISNNHSNLIIPVLLGCILSSCASVPTGKPYTSQQLTPTNKNEARVVIYQPKFFGVQRSPLIKVNGVDSCELSPNTFFVTNAAVGKELTITTDLWDSFGTSKGILKPDAQQIHYIQVEYYHEPNPGILFGAIGGAIGGAMSTKDEPPHTGPFVIKKVDKEYAEYQLRDAHETLACK